MKTIDTLTAHAATQPTPVLLGALEQIEAMPNLERHERLARIAIVSAIEDRHNIHDRMDELLFDESAGFDGTELQALYLALAEVGA